MVSEQRSGAQRRKRLLLGCPAEMEFFQCIKNSRWMHNLDSARRSYINSYIWFWKCGLSGGSVFAARRISSSCFFFLLDLVFQTSGASMSMELQHFNRYSFQVYFYVQKHVQIRKGFDMYGTDKSKWFNFLLWRQLWQYIWACESADRYGLEMRPDW